MKRLILPVMSMTMLLSSHAIADTLLLMDGQTVNGTIISLDKNTVNFELGGQQIKFERSKVQRIDFKHNIVQASDLPIEEVEKLEKNAPVIVPVNTAMMVRMTSTINSSKHKAGHKFTSRLEAAIVIDKEIVIPRGTTVYGMISESKKSSRLAGTSNMNIKFTDILLNNQLVPIITSDIKTMSESTTKDTVSRTARFAAVGGLANGSKGAENAAKAGLGLSLLTSGNSITISSGTLLEFSITSPISI